MPKLDWIGKNAVVRHHGEVHYRLLHCSGRLSAGDSDSGNLLVQGDNLEALRTLLPYYAGKVKCIYIDPPYNTGNEGWAYNDKVNSPQIKKWLDKVVGGEEDDLCRHDKWLCMMYPRLRLLRDFLSEDGVIFVSIDDNEQHHLRMLMSEIFGSNNFIANITVFSNPRGRQSSKHVAASHEYCLAFAKDIENATLYGLPLTEEEKKEYKQNDEHGQYREIGLRLRGGRATAELSPTLHFPLYVNTTEKTISVEKKKGFIEIIPKFSDGELGTWRWSKERIVRDMDQLKTRQVARNNVLVYDIFEKDYLYGHTTRKAKSLWAEKEINYDFGAKEIKRMFGKKIFSYSKPVSIIRKIIKIATDQDSLILDSFAGSGTTAHAVLQQNKEDGGNRKFILVEMEKEISENITAKRIQKAIKGYKYEKLVKKEKVKETVVPLGGGFRFCTLGSPLFDEYGNVSIEVKFSDLAAHVFFSHTGMPIPKRAMTSLLGAYQDDVIYLLYNGIMGDKSKNGGNVLTSKTLSELPPPPRTNKRYRRIIYGEACLLRNERLQRENIVFRQIPYGIREK